MFPNSRLVARISTNWSSRTAATTLLHHPRKHEEQATYLACSPKRQPHCVDSSAAIPAPQLWPQSAPEKPLEVFFEHTAKAEALTTTQLPETDIPPVLVSGSCSENCVHNSDKFPTNATKGGAYQWSAFLLRSTGRIRHVTSGIQRVSTQLLP